MFIEQNLTFEDISRFTIDDFARYNMNQIVASSLLGKKIIKSFKGIKDGDETEAILIMLKEHYEPKIIQKAIDSIHERNNVIDKNSLYTELNNDIKAHPQKCIYNIIIYKIVRELNQVLDGCNKSDKDREKEKNEAKNREKQELESKMHTDCTICLDRPASCFYSGCGHLCICDDCAKDYTDKCVKCTAAGHPIKVNFPPFKDKKGK